MELVDKLYEALDANNIEIVDEPDADVEEFTLTEDTVERRHLSMSSVCRQRRIQIRNVGNRCRKT